jgi:hypothetical protein
MDTNHDDTLDGLAEQFTAAVAAIHLTLRDIPARDLTEIADKLSRRVEDRCEDAGVDYGAVGLAVDQLLDALTVGFADLACVPGGVDRALAGLEIQLDDHSALLEQMGDPYDGDAPDDTTD